MYLLDTDVVSELRRTRPHGAVVAWLTSVKKADLRLSAATVGEIQAGIELTRQQDPDKATEIEMWLNRVLQTYAVLSMDADAFRLWAKLMHRQSDDLYEDAMIAATAIQNGLIVVTRNIRDFKQFSVETLDPFAS